MHTTITIDFDSDPDETVVAAVMQILGNTLPHMVDNVEIVIDSYDPEVANPDPV